MHTLVVAVVSLLVLKVNLFGIFWPDNNSDCYTDGHDEGKQTKTGLMPKLGDSK